MWRVLSFVFNPIGAIFWPILRGTGRRIDRSLGPAAGWYVALALAIISAVALASTIYAVSGPIGRLTGVTGPISALQIPGVVTQAQTVRRKFATVTQTISVAYESDGHAHMFAERVVQPVSRAHEVGDEVVVYLAEGAEATIDNPNDPIRDAVFAAIGLVLPALLLISSLVYLRHRGRIYRARALQSAPGTPAAAMRGHVLTTAQRLAADRDRTRKLAGGR